MSSELAGAVIEISNLSKNYQGLRPLRIEQLSIGAAEHVALLGLDRPMAETLINLVTGATLPDTGTVSLFGKTTASIENSDEWLGVVDRFGIVSERAVLLDALSVIQNLAIPFTLELDPLPDDIRDEATRLAQEMGLPDAVWAKPVSVLDAEGRLRLRVARALALNPAVLLLEHASAGIDADSTVIVGTNIRQAAERRRCALVAATVDPRFAAAVARRVLIHEPATGRVSERRTSLLQRLFHH